MAFTDTSHRIFAFRNRSLLEEHNITHVLSVIKYDLTKIDGFDFSNLSHLSMDIDDVEESDILIHLPKLVRFIEQGLYGDASSSGDSKGAVLVHCAAGKSRSVTAVVAWLLWKYPHRFGSTEASNPDRATTAANAVKRAVEWVRETRSLAGPNEGFMKQLELWWEMGCPAESDDAVEKHRTYRRWAYRREVEEAAKLGMAPDRLMFEDEEVKQKDVSVAEAGLELRCKKCRRVLATKPFIVPHNDTAAPQSSCPHYFIEPLSWMRPTLEEGVLEGRLMCPGARCGASIGRYSWQGFKCSCKEWVCPAFSLQKTKVDEVATAPPRGPVGRAVAGAEASRMAALGIRLPPGHPAHQNAPAKENL